VAHPRWPAHLLRWRVDRAPHNEPMRSLIVGLSLLVGVLAVPALAQSTTWATPPLLDPLRMASLPPDPFQAEAPRAGSWEVAASSGYFNVFLGSWHTTAIHREYGLKRRPLARWELRTLEQRHPQDAIFHFDVEGWRSDLTFSYGLGRGYGIGVRIPYLVIGSPHWDAIPEEFHSSLGMHADSRTLFAHGQTAVYVKGKHGTVEAWDELARSGLGDVSVAISGPLGGFLGGRQRWVAALEAPTGREGTLAGSGGWDLAARWFASWGEGQRAARIAVGYTWLDRNGSFLGVRRANTWHAFAEMCRPLGRRSTFRSSARVDASPLADFTDSVAARPSLYLTLGVLHRFGAERWLAFDMGENIPLQGVVPDFTVHLQVGTRLSGSR